MQALAAALTGAVGTRGRIATRRRGASTASPTTSWRGVSTALVHLATAEMYTDRFEASGRHAERALAIGRATGQGDLFPLIFPMLGTALWVQGRVAESARIFDDAIDAARCWTTARGSPGISSTARSPPRAAGDFELAMATARESIELAARQDDSIISAHAAWALAAPLLETGEADEAAELLLASTGGPELRLIPGGWRAYGLELLHRCLLEAGRRDEAERAAQAAQECAETVGLPLAAAVAGARRGRARARRRATRRAPPSRRSPRPRALEEAGCVFDAAVSRQLAGRALAQAGERTGPPPSSSARRAPSPPSAPMATTPRPSRSCASSDAASTTGRARARRTGSASRSLTERELEVARLIVDRKTNPQIAAALFLSHEDRRVAHPEHVPQARRRLARRARARRSRRPIVPLAQ